MRIIVGATFALIAASAAEAQVSAAAGSQAFSAQNFSATASAVPGRGTDSRLASALNDVAFSKPTTAAPTLAGASAKSGRAMDASANLSGGAFATPMATGSDGDSASLLDGARYDSGHGVTTQWDAQSFVLSQGPTGAVNSVRLSLASPTLIPGLGPRDLQAQRFSPDAFDVTVTRTVPQAVKFDAGRLNVDVTPHAGVGFGNTGGSAEAGAVVRVGVGQNLEDRVFDALGNGGVKNGKAFGNRDRWYLFAAASGRAVGLNVLRQDGDWNRAGWSQDPTSSLVGDAQLGLGWRRGPMQTSFGYVHRRIKFKEAVMGLRSQNDDVVALSFSFKPHK